jgi:protein ImuB
MQRRFFCLYLPQIDEHFKQRIVEWCDRYSPLVAHDGPDGIVLDITGCAHLFGGEAALLDDVQAHLKKIKLKVRGAIAGTVGAAWGLARFGTQAIVTNEELPRALDSLPVAALRLEEQIAAGLCRLGLVTIGILRSIPHQSLTVRYGPSVVLRLNQALGHAEEPITPYRAPAPYRAARTFAEPIGTTAPVEHVLFDLLTEICLRLEKEHRGARRFELDCFRVDASVARPEVRTSKPARSITHLMRLFGEKLNGLDAGFGIEAMVLSAFDVDALKPAQLTLPGCGDGIDEDGPLDELLDRFGLRLGWDHVCRYRICESLLPEYCTEFVSVIGLPATSAKWPEYRIRPVHLIDPPVPIEVSEIIPGKSPVQIRIGGQLHRIVRSEGPERLTPEWWHDKPLRWRTRDYYRIENEQGNRFWIFRETDRWFLHGQFP